MDYKQKLNDTRDRLQQKVKQKLYQEKLNERIDNDIKEIEDKYNSDMKKQGIPISVKGFNIDGNGQIYFKFTHPGFD